MAEPIHGPKLYLLTISLSLAIFMNVLDVSIANVAIPYLAGDLGVSPNQGTWVITSFTVSQAIMLPITGWLAKRFGEVRLFVISTLLFTITSILCGLSTSFPMLLLFRVMQGAVAGPMIPLSQSLLLNAYPESKKGLATGIWAMVAVIAPIFGPIVGGWITYNYSWPWIFYINLPVGLFCVFSSGILLSGRETAIIKAPIDVVGLTLLVIGVGCLQILLDKGNDLDWFNSNFIILLSIVSFITLTFLVVWELTDKNPVIDLTLFLRRNYTIGVIALGLGYMVYFSNIVIFPLWLQTQMGYTAAWAGLAAAPIGVLSFFLTPFVGLTLNRVDPRIFASIGFVVFAVVSFWNGSFNTDVDFYTLIIPRFVQGIGIAFFFTPLLMILLSDLPVERTASALGLANFLRILGSSFGTSLSVTLWDRREQFHHSQLIESITNYNLTSIEAIQHLQHLGVPRLAAYDTLDLVATNQAYMLSTNDIFWLSGIFFICLLIIVWFAKPPFLSTGGTAMVVD